MRKSLLLLAVICLLLPLLASCNQDTAYQQPPMSVPDNYRWAGEGANATPSFGDLYWGNVIQDPVLKDLIRTALVQNYDARMAAEKILQAEAQLGLARSAQFPIVGGNAQYTTGQTSAVGATPVPPGTNTSTYYTSLGLQASFQLDFWGQYRRATDAARASLAATQEGRNTVQMTVVSNVATSYLTLRELDLELEISRQTLESRLESYRLVKAREEGGIATMLDVDQAKGLVLSAQTAMTQAEQSIAQQEDLLSLLLGLNPQAIPRGNTLDTQLSEPPIPPGLPSSLLERRPDIRQAEQQLIAANAKIDVARAAYYPQISLTAAGGTLSKEFSGLFTGPSYTWSFTPQLLQPIFNAGSIRSQVKITQSQQRQAVITYQSTVQTAFKEVSDALIGYNKSRQFRAQQEELAATLKDQARLSNLRYIGGVTSYLEVLDSERQYFEAEIGLARAQLNELLYIIKLYQALGGGWKPEPATAAASPSPGPSATPAAAAATASPQPSATPAASPSPQPSPSPAAAPAASPSTQPTSSVQPSTQAVSPSPQPK